MSRARKFFMILGVFAMVAISTGCMKSEVVAAAISSTEESREIAFVTEDVCNSANYECTLCYDPSLDLNMEEEYLLAKMADYEGGNDEEKEMIMKVIASRKQLDNFPDDIKSIICQRGMFLLQSSYWNSMEAPTKERVNLAKEILESEEVCEYTYYDFKWPGFMEKLKSQHPDTDILELENFVFWK